MQQGTHEQRSLWTKNWHVQFENIECYGSTGSEMKPFLVKLQRVVNCWTDSFFLPCASRFAGGVGAGFGVLALLTNRAALTQNMNFVHLKPKVSQSTHGTQQNELKN